MNNKLNSEMSAETTADKSGVDDNTKSSHSSANTFVSGLCSRLKEIARPCPNCGEIYWDSELCYSSIKVITVGGGSLHSTLYGVCKRCADLHSR